MACRTADSRNWGAKDVNTMPDNSRISQQLYLLVAQALRVTGMRAALAAIALFCIAATTAPPVLAQPQTACGPPINLSANQWRMVGVPCQPSPGSVSPPRPDRRNVSGVFGPSLGINNYGVTWIVWKRVYDDSQCAVSSGPADCYVKLTLASPANVGDSFWIYTTQATTVQFSSTFTNTPGPNFAFPARLATGGNSRYYMFANPYREKVRWADLRFATTVTFLGNTFPVEVGTAQAVTATIVSKNVHYWNGNTYYTRDLSAPEATFDPKEAAWLEMLTPAPIVTSGVTVKVPQP
jgi:hypothetical protein